MTHNGVMVTTVQEIVKYANIERRTGRKTMADCINCKYAVLDYEEYYNTTEKQWFVEGCKKDMPDAECCPEFEEWEDNDG